MNPKEHRADFNRRWNISSTPDSPQEAVKTFKKRILTVFQNIYYTYYDNNGYEDKLQTTIDNIVTEESIFNFCQNYCIDQKYHYYNYNIDHKITIIDRLKNESNEKEFYRLIEIILSLDISSISEKNSYGHDNILVSGKKIKNTLIKFPQSM